jgi:hypothetical protein
MKKVWLLTTGDGSDGNEWRLESIHSSEVLALKAQILYNGPVMRGDGSSYMRESDVEEWDMEE